MPHAWADSNFAKRIEITAPSPTANVAAFPFPVNLAGLGITDTDIVQDEWAFYDLADNHVHWEREAYAEAGGTCTGIIWTFLDLYSAPSGEQNHLWFYYKKTAGSVPGNTATDVWDANFRHVYHLGEDPSGGAPQMLNSKSGSNDGTSAGTMLTADLVAAKVANGLDFDGSNDEIDVPLHADLVEASAFTAECWVKANAAAQTKGFLNVQNDATGAGQLAIFYLWNGYNGLLVGRQVLSLRYPDAALTQTNWNHIALVSTGGANATLYVNGAAQANTLNSALSAAGSDQVMIGRGIAGYFANAVVDELRVSVTNRSGAWIAEEYTVVTSGLTYGGIESIPATGSLLVLFPNLVGNLSPHLRGGMQC